MKRAARVDDNQREIVPALRAAGAGVVDLSGVGKGCPDLLVAHRQRWVMLEVKDGRKPPSARRLTAEQQKWHATHRAPIYIVTSVDSALRAIGAVREPSRYALDNCS